MSYSRSAGGVVINPDGHILVVKQRGGSWSLPKGHVNPGESLLRAARREIYEESGISQLHLIRLLGSYQRSGLVNRQERHREIKQLTFFLFSTTQRRLKPLDPHNPEARWVPRQEVGQLLSHRLDQKFFYSILPTI